MRTFLVAECSSTNRNPWPF